MSEQIYSQVSAFLDDELVDAESELLIRRLCRDKEVASKLGRYGLIGESMRGSAVGFDNGLAHRISQAVADHEAGPAKARRSGMRSNRFLKPAAGLAVAASVAAAALLVISPQLGPDGSGAPIATIADVGQASAYVVPAAKAQNSADAMLQLNRYLMQHSEYASRIQPSSVFSYRVVGYGDVETDIPAEESPAEQETE